MTPADSKPVRDQRIRAAVIVAPALGFTFSPDGLRHVNIPLQLWRAEQDTILPHPRYAHAVWQALPGEPDYRVVAKAGRFDLLPPCSSALAAMAPAICHSDPAFDRPAFQQAFNGAVVDFFHQHLPHIPSETFHLSPQPKASSSAP